MRQIIIASHGELANGMSDTLQFLGISSKNIYTLCAYKSNKPIDDEVKALLNKFDEKKDEIIVFTDIMSGSVNQSIFPYVKDKGVKLITGMSLPLLMAVSLYPQNRVLTDENIRKLISEAQEQIKFMNDYKPALDDDDE